MTMGSISARFGVAAFAIGVSVLGPQCLGVASADSGPDTQSSATPRAHHDAARKATTGKPAAARSAASRRKAAASSTPRAAALMASKEETPIDGTPPRKGKVEPEAPSVVQRIDSKIYGAVDDAANRLAELPDTALSHLLQGSFLLIRRTLFDQAPTVTPRQTTGQLAGPITGSVGAVDPENDKLYYQVVLQPRHGTVDVGADGTFTYTPGSDFSGRDVFTVAAGDRKSQVPGGLRGNIINPLRPTGTEGLVIVSQGTKPEVNFSFTYYQTRYGLKVGRWTANGKVDMQWAAYALADEVVAAKNITLTYNATAMEDRSTTLASAGSDYTKYIPGFFPTVVQSRIQTGSDSVVDENGPVADGRVTVNFGAPWGYGGTVRSDEFEFAAVMLHEFLHSFGFLSEIFSPECNVWVCDSYGKPTDTKKTPTWATFDKFVTNKQGIIAIDPTTYVFKPAFNDNLTGANEGMYFNGINARTAFDGPVPLFTPKQFIIGSSMSHMNDAYFNDKKNTDAKNYIQLMNADDAPGQQTPRTLSPYEIGILKDIGYTMSTPV